MHLMRAFALFFLLASSLSSHSGLVWAADATGEELPAPRIVLARDAEGRLQPVGESDGFDALYEELRHGAPRRLLIGLRTPFGPDEINLHGPTGSELYYQNAQKARARFLEDLQSFQPDRDNRGEEELPELPYLVLFPDETLLDFIFDHKNVVSVNTESGGKPQLNETIPFIGADEAHSQGYGGTWQAIAVIDTGVDRTHPMLSGKVVSEACYSSTAYSPSGNICRAGSYGSTVINSGGPCALEPQCSPGHGSHVSGIASGSSVPAGGGVPALKGVANDADIISLMALSYVNSPTLCVSSQDCVYYLEASVVSALNRVYALRTSYPIAAVNLSLILTVSASDYSSSTCDGSWTAVRDAVALLNSAGIQVYGASGNAGGYTAFQNKIGPPACLSKVVSVAATAKDTDSFAGYSNAAGILDALAPGALSTQDPGTSTCRDPFVLYKGIWSAYFQTNCSDRYLRDAGTSMAAPHAAGAHAVLRDRYPGATATALSDWLLASGHPVGFSQGGSSYTKPRIDLDAAMTPPPAPSSGPSGGSVSWFACFGQNMASWNAVSGSVSEYQLQGINSNWTYYGGPATSQFVNVTQTENLRVRACNTVSCGPWTTIGQATYQPCCY